MERSRRGVLPFLLLFPPIALSSVFFFLVGSLGPRGRELAEKYNEGAERDARVTGLRMVPGLLPLVCGPLPQLLS